MKGPVVIFGANGFLGRYLTRHLLRKGREVVAVARERFEGDAGAMFIEWDGRTLGSWALALEGAATVVNLAGRSVHCRYTPENRDEIMQSRVASTKVIGEAIAACEDPPQLWINSSTATIYRDARDEAQTEWTGEFGEGFSVEVASRWEETFFAAVCPGVTRKVVLRKGMVLGNEPDSVFGVVSRLANLGLGGSMAGGGQRVSWIHMDDFLGVVEWIEDQPLVDGVVNVTAPECPTNEEWMRGFREMVAMPLGLPSARWMLEVGALIMRTEAELVTKSRWVKPARLEQLGFRWRWPSLRAALGDLNSRDGMDAFFEVPSRRSLGSRAWTSGEGLRVS